MSSKNPKLSVIVPAYKEAKRIGNTLLDIDKYLSEQEYTYEILVVIDGVSDNTAAVVESYKKMVDNLRYIENKEHHGKGYVVRQGMMTAKGQWRLFMDADGSTSIDHLDKMWPLTQDFNIVIGSRNPKDAKGAKYAAPRGIFDMVLSAIGNFFIQIFGVWGIWDTKNGFKLMSAAVAEDIFSRAKINYWGFDIEVLALARRLGYKIGRVPVYYKNEPRDYGKLARHLHTAVELFKVRWNLIRNIYNLP